MYMVLAAIFLILITLDPRSPPHSQSSFPVFIPSPHFQSSFLVLIPSPHSQSSFPVNSRTGNEAIPVCLSIEGREPVTMVTVAK